MKLAGKTIAILVAEGVEDLEYYVPLMLNQIIDSHKDPALCYVVWGVNRSFYNSRNCLGKDMRRRAPRTRRKALVTLSASPVSPV